MIQLSQHALISFETVGPQFRNVVLKIKHRPMLSRVTEKKNLHGTILGPLLFNIHVNRMKETITENCELIQYSDDTMIFSANTNEKEALKNLE